MDSNRPQQLDLFNAALLEQVPVSVPAAEPQEKEKQPSIEQTFRIQFLRVELAKRTDMEIDLRINNNTSTVMTIRYENNRRRARVNLHHMFLDAPEKVLAALALWIEKPRAKAAGQVLNSYIRNQRERLQPKKVRREKLQTQGEVHDLQMLYDAINETVFHNEVATRITWGRMPAQYGRRRSIRFGSHCSEQNLIRIHPLLDQKFVPAYFVKYIVFHEMLHAWLGVERGPGGRRIIHSKKFRELEKKWPDYERAISWMAEKRTMDRLLKRRTLL